MNDLNDPRLTTEYYLVTREVGPDECPWLKRIYNIGERLWHWSFFDHDTITEYGVAVTDKAGQYPFFEFPINAIEIREHCMTCGSAERLLGSLCICECHHE